ncbi:MAG: DUF421 domain-containing protein [Oscillospiraceae bacterium]|nr:DUF421 domain-containing protein [Oscillospiraceae bacterium]
MFVTIIRTLILYFTVICVVRLMGKRQIGELQPSELVVTLLLSEIIAMPMENNDIPLISTIIPVMILVTLEIITSAISMKSLKFRFLVQGHPIIIIRNGVLQQKEMKKLRLTIDDILESLRQKDIFDISLVAYGIIETNGKMSVMLKPDYETVINKDAGIKPEDSGIPCVVITDGQIERSSFGDCNMTDEKLKKIIKEQKIDVGNTLLMTLDKSGKSVVIEKNI